MTAYENIRYETVTPAFSRLTVNRPQKMNCLSRATLREVANCLDLLAPPVRVLAITGAGEKAFIAGADIAEMQSFTVPEAHEMSKLGHAVLSRFEQMNVVVIAEVNGYALGGGCETMLACDFAIAAENAKIGQPEVALGITAGFGGTTRLVRRVGAARARQILYTGEAISAAEAKAMGLVNEVVPRAELRARVDAIAEKIIKNGPQAVIASKRSLAIAEETDLATANAYEQQVFALGFATEDQKEGMRAFVEKRAAIWQGR
jgi:enoyl-CoA hydratase